MSCLLHHVGHLDLFKLVIDVDVFFEAVLQELLESLLLAITIVYHVIIVLLQLQLEIRYHRSVVRKVYRLDAPVVQLFHFCIPPPQNPITESWDALFLTGVILLSPQVILISRLEINSSLLELVEKKFHMLLVSRLFFLYSLARCLSGRFLKFNLHFCFVLFVVIARE